MSTAFTQQLITHQYLNADGTPASGSVEFTLTQAMTNGSVTMTPGSHVTAPLDSSGNITSTASAGVGVLLTSTEDVGTISQGNPQWRCDERVSGAEPRSFFFELPPGPGFIDLGALEPGNNLETSTSTEAG